MRTFSTVRWRGAHDVREHVVARADDDGAWRPIHGLPALHKHLHAAAGAQLEPPGTHHRARGGPDRDARLDRVPR